MSIKTIVQTWFAENFGGSLFLPDGWYGRPYDNQHNLTSIDENRDSVVIVLDNRITLQFVGLHAVKPAARELVFGPFAKLRVEVDSIGDGRRTLREYGSGEVKIVSAPG